MPRFAETFCSQCGKSFGPGEQGYSHCIDHKPKIPEPWMPLELETMTDADKLPVKAEKYYPAVLRELADQLGVGNDFYYPLRGAAALLDPEQSNI